jgi:hypothetical protein
MTPHSLDAAAIEAEVDRVRSLGIAALRQRWRLMFGGQPPAGLTRDLIRRMIAYRIQEEAFGGLDYKTVKLLDRLARGERPVELKRRLKPGTVLVREYQGARHTVTVVPGGFLWREQSFASLSTIARAITGTAWNGPRFFGLRVARGERSTEKAQSAQAPPKRARRRQRAIGPARKSNIRAG